MSISIDTNMYLLCSLFNISYKKIATEYSGKTVKQIMEAEAAQGNVAAANYDETILSDPIKLIELFQLRDPNNKFMILNNMNENDMEDLLPLLEKHDLVAGLNFFTKDKLLKLIEYLPKDQLLKYTFDMFPPEKIMQLLPEEQLNKILKSTKIDKDVEIEYLKSLKPEILAKMLESVTGQPAPGSDNIGVNGESHYDSKVLLNQIINLQDDKFQDAMLNMPSQNKRLFVLKLAKQNPDLYYEVDSHAYVAIMRDKKEKDQLVRSAVVIEPEQLCKMLENLPKELSAVVLTQIDTNKFADVLLKNFKDIIREIVAV